MIVLDSLVTGYSGDRSRAFRSKPFSASLEAGKVTCLVGRNGAGKSTLLRTMAGIQNPVSGNVYYSCGDERFDMFRVSRRRLASTVSIVLTSVSGIEGLTAYDVVSMGRIPFTGILGSMTEKDRDVVDGAVSLTGIGAFVSRPFDSLSDGERQKVMIAKSVAQQTPVILLDEPSAFLDYPSRVELMDMLHGLAHEHGKTIMLSSHDLDMVKKTADSFWILSADGLQVTQELTL